MNNDDKKTTNKKQLAIDDSLPGVNQEQATEPAVPEGTGAAAEITAPDTKEETPLKETGGSQEALTEGEQEESLAEIQPEAEEAAANQVDKNPEVIAAEEKTPTEETKEPARNASHSDAGRDVTEGEVDIKITKEQDKKGGHWYVVHTYSGHEAKVAATLKQRIESQRLADKILEILVPTQEKIEIREGKKSTVREKLFPGYILIKMILDDATWLAVRTTPGITSFVGNANKPTPLPESEVGTIQRFMTMEAPKFKAAFTVGEAVKITDGPFSDFLGSISEIDDEKGKVKVLVSIFGRETPVELDFLQIAKL